MSKQDSPSIPQIQTKQKKAREEKEERGANILGTIFFLEVEAAGKRSLAFRSAKSSPELVEPGLESSIMTKTSKRLNKNNWRLKLQAINSVQKCSHLIDRRMISWQKFQGLEGHPPSISKLITEASRNEKVSALGGHVMLEVLERWVKSGNGKSEQTLAALLNSGELEAPSPKIPHLTSLSSSLVRAGKEWKKS